MATSSASRFRRFGQPLWIRAGDEVAYLLIVMILIGGMLQLGYAREDGRSLLYLGCALLGGWSVVGWMAGRWNHPGLRQCLWVLLFFALAIVWTKMQLLSFPRGFVTALSPIWREWANAMEQSGMMLPDRLTFALEPEKGLASWNQLVASAFFFSAVCLLAQRGGMALRLAFTVVMVSVLSGWLGLWRYVLQGVDRSWSFVLNPNHHGALVMMGMPLMLALLMWNHRRRKAKGQGDLLGGSDPTLLLLGIGLAALVGGLVSFSRGVILFGGSMLALWGAKEIIGNRLAERSEGRGLSEFSPRYLVVPGLLVVALLFVALSADLFLTRFDGATLDQSRAALTVATFRGLGETNLIGMGLRGAEPMLNRHHSLATVGIPIYSHNDWAQWIGELGAPGVILGLMALVGFAISGVRIARQRANSFTWKQRAIQRAAVWGVIIALVHAVAEFHLRIPLIGFLFLMLLALALCNGLLFAHGGPMRKGRDRDDEPLEAS